MRKINTKGLEQANKCMTLSAVAYNLKKLLKHSSLLINSKVNTIKKGFEATIELLSREMSDSFNFKYFAN